MPKIFENAFKPTKSAAFRDDIAGIRGIAVLMVVLCHFKIPGFTGGFIGPDIFFVLSGYLISGLLIREYEAGYRKGVRRGRISLSNFYLRRIRRILPAAVFVIICINLWAKFNFNTFQIAAIKTDSTWTLFFAANIYFLRQSTNYFADTTFVSPLQHYWSLSVEEQFYFFWPMLVIAVLSFNSIKYRGRKFRWKGNLTFVFTTVAVLSLAYLVFEFKTNPQTAYFSTFCRAWELALGGLLSLLSSAKLSEKLSPKYLSATRISTVLILLGSLAIVRSSNFGYTLVIPVIATGYLLFSGEIAKGDLVDRVLSTRLFTALGTISFSLYLWHWPVFVFGNQGKHFQTLLARLIGILICLILAIATYWLVERTFLNIPLPKTQKSKPKTGFSFKRSKAATSVTVLLIVLAMSYVTYPAAYGKKQTDDFAVGGWQPPTEANIVSPNYTGGSTTNKPVTSTALLDKWQAKVQSAVQSNNYPSNPRQATSPNCSTITIDPSLPKESCIREAANGVKKPLVAVLIGDSHARMLWRPIVGTLPASKWRVEMIAKAGCPVPDYITGSKLLVTADCARHHTARNARLAKLHPDLVIMSGIMPGQRMSDSDFIASYQNTISFLKQHAKKILMVDKTPSYPNVADCVDKNLSLDNCEFPREQGTDNRYVKLQVALAQSNDIANLNLAQYICTSQSPIKCPVFIGDIPVNIDRSHITGAMAEAITPIFQAEFKRLSLTNP